MQTDVQIDKNDYFTLLMEIEEKKQEYKVERRQLMWFLKIVLGVIVIFTGASIAEDYLGSDPYVNVWGGFAIFAAIILSIIFFCRFFNVVYYIASFFGGYDDEKFGFQGIGRIKKLISLKDEIEAKETSLQILEKYQTHKLSIEEQYDLYKDELLLSISQYQQKANRNRTSYFILQMIIVASSLFVGGLTSGLANSITFFGSHWLAPALSFTVSFLTAMVTLFRPRERSYNLQQTADAIQFEISCADRRIYDYKEMKDREAYTRLAEQAEKIRNEQRKRQQQLEQSSEVKQATD